MSNNTKTNKQYKSLKKKCVLSVLNNGIIFTVGSLKCIDSQPPGVAPN